VHCRHAANPVNSELTSNHSRSPVGGRKSGPSAERGVDCGGLLNSLGLEVHVADGPRSHVGRRSTPRIGIFGPYAFLQNDLAATSHDPGHLDASCPREPIDRGGLTGIT
jgi:hypothetical protein